MWRSLIVNKDCVQNTDEYMDMETGKWKLCSNGCQFVGDVFREYHTCIRRKFSTVEQSDDKIQLLQDCIVKFRNERKLGMSLLECEMLAKQLQVFL